MVYVMTLRKKTRDGSNTPIISLSGELEDAVKRGPGGKEKDWTDCEADDLWLFDTTADWSTAALDPGVWYSAVHEAGCRFMAAWWVKEEENASNQRQKKREARKRRTRLRLHLLG